MNEFLVETVRESFEAFATNTLNEVSNSRMVKDLIVNGEKAEPAKGDILLDGKTKSPKRGDVIQ